MPEKRDKQIQVFLIENSFDEREPLANLLDADPEIQVIGVARNGHDAIASLNHLKPDLVIIDLHLPRMTGIETIRHIMLNNPVPIIAIRGDDSLDNAVSGFRALEAGAVLFAEIPRSRHSPDFAVKRDDLLKNIKLMSEVKVVRRWVQNIHPTKTISRLQKPTSILRLIKNEIKIIAIGVSTGGPIVLQEIIAHLPQDFPPIVIVQHIASGFIQGLSAWLSRTTQRPVMVAKADDKIKRGHVYLAPDHYNMGVYGNGSIFLESKPLTISLCPSVGFLFHSVAMEFHAQAMGILLTGMGTDGAAELKIMKEQGAITIAQEKESALIYGMPAQAVLLGAATYILTPREIAETISGLGLVQK